MKLCCPCASHISFLFSTWGNPSWLAVIGHELDHSDLFSRGSEAKDWTNFLVCEWSRKMTGANFPEQPQRAASFVHFIDNILNSLWFLPIQTAMHSKMYCTARKKKKLISNVNLQMSVSQTMCVTVQVFVHEGDSNGENDNGPTRRVRK